MREIKFRGKRIDNNKFVYGNLVIDTDGNANYVVERAYWNCAETRDETLYYEVYPETVGQFTGLTDKNGVEIFEGDLMKWTSTDTDGSLMTQIDEVKWSKYGWICGKELQCLANYLLFDPSYENLELIGNIHDKELD